MLIDAKSILERRDGQGYVMDGTASGQREKQAKLEQRIMQSKLRLKELAETAKNFDPRDGYSCGSGEKNHAEIFKRTREAIDRETEVLALLQSRWLDLDESIDFGRPVGEEVE